MIFERGSVMKVIVLIFFLIHVIKACEIQAIINIDDVKDTQECLSEHLELVENRLKEFYKYTMNVEKVYKSLIEEDELCKELNTMLTVSQIPQHCNHLYKVRFEQFRTVSSQWDRINKQIKTIKNQKEAIGLKKDLLESAYDLIIYKGRENLQLKKSIDLTIQKIGKTVKELEILNKGKEKYVTCLILNYLKEDIQLFNTKVEKQENKEAKESLMKLKFIYIDMKKEASYCR